MLMTAGLFISQGKILSDLTYKLKVHFNFEKKIAHDLIRD